VSSPSHDGGGHVTDTEIAAYLDRTLGAIERDRVEDHLAACQDCRQHLLETKELLERVRRPRKLLVGGAMAAAAALVFIIVRSNPGATDRAVMRNDGIVVPMVAYGPMGTAPRAGLRFVWSAVPGAESYRLTVSGEDARTVWSSSGTDTLSALPDSVVLRPNERYHWVADALLSDGSTRSTGLREFDLAR
jgi:putative zinc finger protein